MSKYTLNDFVQLLDTIVKSIGRLRYEPWGGITLGIEAEWKLGRR